MSFLLHKSERLLEIDNQIGESFTPSRENNFKIFAMSIEKIKFVIVVQDPQPGHATGRSFERETDNWKATNTSLLGILSSIYYNHKGNFESIKKVLEEIEDNEFIISSPKQILKEWESEKGVYFLNKSLTTETGSKNTHKDVWNEFII